MEKLLNLKEAMEYLHVSKSSLHRWDEAGKLVALRTSGGHRRYRKSELDKFIGIEEINTEQETKTDIRAVIYARCSTSEQKSRGDIDRQAARNTEYAVKKGYKVTDIIKDCGSGINDKRKGFVKLCNLVVSDKVDKIIIEHKDRLTRFQYDLISFFFSKFGVELEVTDDKEYTPSEELVNDLMMLMTSFSGKLYSNRAKENREKRK